MKKDHKLMGGMVPIILFLCIGLYGIPGALASHSDSNQSITQVDYNGVYDNASTNITQTSEKSDSQNSVQSSSSYRSSSGSTTSGSTTSGSTNTADATPTTDETSQTPSTPETPQEPTETEITV